MEQRNREGKTPLPERSYDDGGQNPPSGVFTTQAAYTNAAYPHTGTNNGYVQNYPVGPYPPPAQAANYPYPRQGLTLAPPPQAADPCQFPTHHQIHKFSLVEAYILSIALGFLGAHHYYLRRPLVGLCYTFTFGLLGVGYVVDWFRLPCLVKRANEGQTNPSIRQKKYLSDAYVFWFPFGLLGFHHFYLGRTAWGFLYFFTFGLLGIGFLVDLFRMPYLVRQANDPEEQTAKKPKSLCVAYTLTLPPFGWLGIQHYYLGRVIPGVFYTISFGLFGIGWLVDICRMPCLVKETNKRILAETPEPRLARLDDAYLLWFPLGGLLGWHHYYLRRPCWGVLYTFTLGCLGIGWLIDTFRIPSLVKEANMKIKARHEYKQYLVTNARAGGCGEPAPYALAPPNVQIVNESSDFTGIEHVPTIRPEDMLPPSYGSVDDRPPSYENSLNEKKY